MGDGPGRGRQAATSRGGSAGATATRDAPATQDAPAPRAAPATSAFAPDSPEPTAPWEAEAEAGRPGDAAADHEAERIFARAVEVHRAGRVVEAVRHYAEALARDPAHIQALNNLGVLLRGQGKQAAAEACYRRALALAPGNASLSNNLGNILREALSHYLSAVETSPEDGGLLRGLGRALADLGRYDEAAAAYRVALERQPGSPRLEVELGTVLLAAGRYAAGFEALEARRRLKGARGPFHELPPWQGEALPAGGLLVHGEPGAGDTLFFLRWLPALAEQGLSYHLVLPAELRRLVGRLPGCLSLIDEEGGGLPSGGRGLFKVGLGSLPHLLGLPEPPRLDERGFLTPPPGPVLAPPGQPGRRLAIGLVWAGRDGDQGPGLERLIALAGRPGLQLLALQKGSAVADLVTAGASGLVHDMSQAFDSFADMARLLPRLDLVVAVDGPISHLCGAMGVPCWLLLPYAGDWRYPRGRDASPWYPRHRLFRQREPGNWASAVEALLAAVDARLTEAAHGQA